MKSSPTPAALTASQSPTAPARRSWLKRLAATVGGGLLARVAAASPTDVQTGGGDAPYVGEIIMTAFDYTPSGGYFPCDGRILNISQYTALFALLGTTYGGNGTTTFGLPDLRGTSPLGAGQGQGLSNYSLGQRNTSESVALTTTQLPAHTHTLPVNAVAATSNSPVNNVPALTAGLNVNGEPVAVQAYGSLSASPAAAAATEIANAGTGQPATLQSPYLVINYLIAYAGIFPSRP